jgi:threonine/homoserine/homoserine lactone efflux protein
MKVFFAIVGCSGVVSLLWLGWIVWTYGGKQPKSHCQMDYDGDLFV